MSAVIAERPSLKPIEALNRLLEIEIGYCRTQVLVAGCKLGVFEELSNGPATAEELSQRIKVPPLGSRRLLMALEHLGLVERKDGRFHNTELGVYCTSKAPVRLGAVGNAAEPFYRMWEYLPDAVREQSPRWEQALGASSADVFASLYADPVRLRNFAALMNVFSIPQGQLIAERIDFRPFSCVMDVAGGPGGMATQIGLRHPHLRGILTDMAPVCKVAEEQIQALGLAQRFKAVPIDLFAGPYPRGADVIILGYILHDWSDESCRTILKNCFEALPSGGMLLVVEKVLNDDYSGAEVGLMIDLMMLVVCEPGARERNTAEYRALLEQAGYRQVEVIRMDAPRDVVVARKP